MAHIRDRGKGVDRRWQARYRDPSGKQVSRTFTRKLDGQRWLDSVTADVLTGRYVDPRAGRVTFSDFAERWLATQTFDASTREAVESRLRVHALPHLREDGTTQHQTVVDTGVARRARRARPYLRARDTRQRVGDPVSGG